MFAPWKEGYEQPRQHITKQRHYFVNKCSSSQGCGFSSRLVLMWELDYKESWVLKNWCWRRLLWVPWTSRRSNQSILKEINSECLLEGLMLKLKLQHICHLMQRANWLEKTLVLGKIEGRGGEGDDRGWDGWMASSARWRWVLASCRIWWWSGTGKPAMQQPMGLERVRQTWLTNELNIPFCICTITSLSMHLSVNIYVASMFSLL